MYARLNAISAIAGTAIALAAASCATEADRLLDRGAMARDVRKLERTLRLTHPAVGRTASAQDLVATRERILADLPDSATVLAFAGAVQPLLDTLRGGHVGIYPRGIGRGSRRSARRSRLPLSPRRLTDGRVVVAQVAEGSDTALIGEEVVAVEGQPIAGLLDEISRFGGGSDGPNVTGVAERAARRIPSYLAWRDGARDTFHVELRRGAPATGREAAWPPYAVALPAAGTAGGRGGNARERRRRRAWRPLGYGFDADRGVAVLDVNSFSGYDPLNFRWPIALRRAVARARRDGARGLVLDLRGNGGGRSANVATLLRQVVVEPTPLYGPWTLPRSGWLNASPINRVLLGANVLAARGEDARFGRWMRHRVKPRRRGFAGRVVVLIDGGTFSAAAATAAVLKSSRRATLVGREAGGNYHETYAGLFSTVALRDSGLVLRVPHLLIPVAVDPSVQSFGESLQPDVAWPLRREALLTDTDEVLLLGLELAAGEGLDGPRAD